MRQASNIIIEVDRTKKEFKYNHDGLGDFMESVESLSEEDGDMYDMLQASTDKKSLLDKLDACQNLSGNAIDLVLPAKRAKTEPNVLRQSIALTEHKI